MKDYKNINVGDLQNYIGKQCLYKKVKKTIGAVYVYINKNGIKSIRFRFKGEWHFVNFEAVEL